MSSPYNMRAFSIDLRRPGGCRAANAGRNAEGDLQLGRGIYMRWQREAGGRGGQAHTRGSSVQGGGSTPHLGEGTETSSVTMTVVFAGC